MENGEAKISEKEVDELSGFSEKQADASLELHAGQWLDLNNKKIVTQTKGKQTSTTKKSVNIKVSSSTSPNSEFEKISNLLASVEDSLHEKISKYKSKIKSKEIGEGEVLLKEISGLQSLQKILLKALLFDSQGTLDISKLPKEAQNLLK